ncbi:MAG: chemotaxis protein CheW [Leptolinea sp.]
MNDTKTQNTGLSDEQSMLLVTFGLGGAWYGLEASQVHEVILVEGNSVVYHSPPYVRGIINLRGKIVTVLDVESKLGLSKHQVGADSRILIVAWNHEQVGLLVEVVAEVISLNKEQIEPVPLNISEKLRVFLCGVYSGEERLIGILDLEKVLAV